MRNVLNIAIFLVTEVVGKIGSRLILPILLWLFCKGEANLSIIPSSERVIATIVLDLLAELELHPLNQLQIVLTLRLHKFLDLSGRMGTSMCLAMPRCSKQFWSILKLNKKSISVCAFHFTLCMGTFAGNAASRM